MNIFRKAWFSKVLEAVGLAALIVGLVQGIYGGDMWGELYLFLGGMAVFYAGRTLEKKDRSQRTNS